MLMLCNVMLINFPGGAAAVDFFPEKESGSHHCIVPCGRECLHSYTFASLAASVDVHVPAPLLGVLACSALVPGNLR